MAMANSVFCCGYVLMCEDGHIFLEMHCGLKMKVDGRKGDQKGHGQSRLRKKA